MECLFPRSGTEEYIQKIRNTANALGLEIPNLHCDNCSVCSNDPEEQEANRKYAMHMLRVGVKLGVKGVRIDWGVRAETLTPRQFAELIDLDVEVAELLYSAYALDQSDYGALVSGVTDYEVPFIDME